MRRGRVALAAVAAMALAAGVAVGQSSGGDASRGTVLTVSYRSSPDAAAQRATLRCGDDRATGTGRLRTVARGACATVRKHRAVLTGPRSNGPCTQIYGGAQTARVTGSLGATRVDRRFDRVNGCRISEWQRLHPLLPRTSGAR